LLQVALQLSDRSCLAKKKEAGNADARVEDDEEAEAAEAAAAAAANGEAAAESGE